MKDYVYIPKHLALTLLGGSAPWEHVESVVTLLTIGALREPCEIQDGYSTYIARFSDVNGRFKSNTPFFQYGTFVDNEPVPYIADFKPAPKDKGLFSYKIHDICNPARYDEQHEFMSDFRVFPVNLWRLPRHVLIRWRYSCKMPIHKSNFIPKKELPEGSLSIVDNLREAQLQFTVTTKLLFEVLCQCDESSLSYAFACHVYFFVHDKLLHLQRSRREDAQFFELLALLNHCVRFVAYTDMHPTKAVEMLEGLFRGILPPLLFGRHPFNLFSETCFKQEAS